VPFVIHQEKLKLTCVIEAIYPGLGVGLGTLDGAEVVRFAIVIPGVDLDEVKVVTLRDNVLPPGRIQVRACVVDPLKAEHLLSLGSN
jgi:hypothetical protein